MAHVSPRAAEDVPELAAVFAGAKAAMGGFVPNSMLTMAHIPQLPMAFSMLANVVFGGDLKALVAGFAVPEQADTAENLPPELVQLTAFAGSIASGCRYCQAHTSHNGHRSGADDTKFADILNAEESPAFSDAERAVISLALAAGAVPNESEPRHFERLREHFSERQIVQIVSVISLFGFLNRWNDTMATQLESIPSKFASETLAAVEWQVGKHGG